MQSLLDFFANKNFIPHGYCLSWNAVLLWLHVVSDVLITLSYYSIPLSLAYFIRQRKDQPYGWLIAMGGLFIIACGTTHLMSVVLIWIPLYWLDGFLKAFTALVSVATALAMLRVIPLVLKLSTPAQLQAEINQRKQAQAALELVNTRFQALFENMRNGVAVYEAIDNGNDFVFRDFNHAGEILDGFKREEVLNKPLTQFFPNVEAFGLLAVLQRVWQTGQAESLPLSFYHDGRLAVYRENYVYRLPSGEVVAVYEDVTPQKQAQQAQQAASERLHKIANQLPCVVFQFVMRTDGSFCVPYASEVLQRIYRLSPEEVLENAAPIFTHVHPEDLSRHLAGIKASAEHLTPWADEYRLKFSDGTESWCWGNALPQREADGSTLWHGFVMDITERKNSATTLAAAKNLLLTIIDTVPMRIFWKDCNLNYLGCNMAFARDAGMSHPDDLLGKDDYQMAWWEQAEIYRSDDSAVINSDIPKISYDEPQTTPTGQTIWLRTSKAPLKNHANQIIGVLGVYEDITERKLMEFALKASETRFRTIIETEPECIKIVDAKGRLIQMNPAGLAMIEADSLAQVAGNPVLSLIAPEYRAAFADLHKRVIAGETMQLQFEVVGLKGGQRWLETHAVPMLENGEVVLLAVTRDITPRKKAEQQLRELNRDFVTFLENTSDFIYFKDQDSRIRFCSQTLATITHHKNWRDLVGKHDFEIFPAETAQVYYEEEQPVFIHGLPLLNKVDPYFNEDGSKGWVSTSKWPVFDFDNQKVIGIFGISRDITQLKKVEENLLRSNADLEQFAYSVSHDMRQPLRSVSSHLQLLARSLKNKLDEDEQENLGFALEGAKRMDAMILSLLDYSRVGRKTETKSWINSRIVLNEALDFLAPAIAEAKVDIKISGEWDEVFVSHDELSRLLMNLIGNAIKYREKNQSPVIDINSILTENSWKVSVRDYGIGINPQHIERLFQFFSRLQSRARFEGTGMGLALCKRIVEHHGGKIWCESLGDGQGCCFVFELPISLPKDAEFNA